MSGHQDRLAGLVVLCAAATGVPRVAVRGIDPALLAGGLGGMVALTETAAAGGGAVVVARQASDASARLEELVRSADGGLPGLVWVVFGGQAAAAVRGAAARAGLEEVAAYRLVAPSTSPTHFVREGAGHALGWFATAVRPRWGRRSQLARVANRLPWVGHRFFDGRAVVFRAPDRQPAWPGSTAGPEVAREGPPAVLHLGGGATAGRLVLTWADDTGTPRRHTKLAPAHLSTALAAEAAALAALAGMPRMTGTVPTLLELTEAPAWSALTASHLPGRPPPGDGAGEGEVDSVVVDWLVALSVASRGATGTVRPPDPDRIAAAAAAAAAATDDDQGLVAAVRRGLELGRTSTGLVHGDLWPGNVHVQATADGAPQVAVLDWESCLVGHPLVDLLTWLVSRDRPDGQVRQGALAVLSGPGPAHPGDGKGRGHAVRALLAALGQPLEPADVEALVLAQLVVIAVAGGPAGGDGTREQAWLDAARDVWAVWHGPGRPALSRQCAEAPCEEAPCEKAPCEEAT